MELLIQAAIGFVSGFLGGLLGIGGSVIIIPAFVYYLSRTTGYTGGEQHLLQAAAMIVNSFVAAPSALAHYRAGAIVKSVVIYLIPAALIGILLGVATSNCSMFAKQNGVYLAIFLALFMFWVAAYNIRQSMRKKRKALTLDEETKNASIPRTVGVGLSMGFVAGLLGIGGGALCVPAQQVFLKLPLKNAIANSATTIMFVAILGAVYKNTTLYGHGFEASEAIGLAMTLIPTAIVGGYLGGKTTHLLPRKMLRVVFIVFMITIGTLTFQKAWLTLHSSTPSKMVEVESN